MSNNASRSWILTLDARPEVGFTQDFVMGKLKSYTYVGQKEKGDSGYEHFQIYIENKGPIKFSTLRNKFSKAGASVYFAPRKGSKQQAYDYVTKDDTRLSPIFSNGDIDLMEVPGKRSDLEVFCESIEAGYSDYELMRSFPEAYMKYSNKISEIRLLVKEQNFVEKPLKVIYLGGVSRTGKTSFVLDLMADACRVDCEQKNKFDQYEGEEVLILDEWKCQMKMTQMNFLLERRTTGNGKRYQLEARYSNKTALYNYVFVLSNLPFSHNYTDLQEYEPEVFAAYKNRFDLICDYVTYNNREQVFADLAKWIEENDHSDISNVSV